MRVTKVSDGSYLITLEYSTEWSSVKAVFKYKPKNKELSLISTDDADSLGWATEEVESFIEKNRNVLK